MIMKKYNIGICGNYDTEKTIANGHTIKTINVTDAIVEQIGNENVNTLNTFDFHSRPITSFARYRKLVKESENLLLVPGESALRKLLPYGVKLKKKFNTKLYYVVIGGWIASLLKREEKLLKYVKSLDGIFVETDFMKKDLESLGVKNIYILPNFKSIKILDEKELVYQTEKPLSICFFARIMEEKGVGELVENVKKINKDEVKFKLDIYGGVDETYVDTFNQMQKEFPDYIKYCGVIDSNKTVEVVKNYYMVAFPTRKVGEGFPGTILDAYASGVPVLSARWDSCNDVVVENKTGLSYEFNNFEEMYELLKRLSDNPDIFNNMKTDCIKEAYKYTPQNVIKIILDRVLGDR